MLEMLNFKPSHTKSSLPQGGQVCQQLFGSIKASPQHLAFIDFVNTPPYCFGPGIWKVWTCGSRVSQSWKHSTQAHKPFVFVMSLSMKHLAGCKLPCTHESVSHIHSIFVNPGPESRLGMHSLVSSCPSPINSNQTSTLADSCLQKRQ